MSTLGAVSAAKTDWNAMDDDAFRMDLRAYFEKEFPDHLRFLPRRLRWAESVDWWKKLSKKGWLAPNWPAKFGGMCISASKQLIFLEEKERHGCCRLNDMGMTMIGPLLIKWFDLAGGGIENWFAYMLALLFLLVRPQGLFGDKIIERI